MASMPPAPDQAEESSKADAPAGVACELVRRLRVGSGQEAAAGMAMAAGMESVPTAAAVAVVDAGDGEGGTTQQLMLIPSSTSQPKVLEHSKIKRKYVDLKTLWSNDRKKPNVQVEQVDIRSVQVQVRSPSVQIQQQPQNVSGISANATTEPEIETDIEDAEYDVELLPRDPGKRSAIAEYDVNEQNRIRRRYIALGPCQPRNHAFPQRNCGGMRRFMAAWFDAHNWLEYSVELDSAFCFVCYLFKDNLHAGGDTFVNVGFRNWNHKDCFGKHVGGINSAHNQAQEKYNFSLHQKQPSKRCLLQPPNKTSFDMGWPDLLSKRRWM